jgi:hypothetical protein
LTSKLKSGRIFKIKLVHQKYRKGRAEQNGRVRLSIDHLPT